MWIIAINGEENITYQGELDELNHHQTPCGKSKINISLCKSKIYQKTDPEEIRSRFDQVRPVFSHLEFSLPKKPPTPNNIGEDLKVPHRQFWKEALFLFNMTETEMLAFFWIPPQSNTSLKEQNFSVNSLVLVLRKVTLLIHGFFLHATMLMGVLILEVLIFINHTDQWHMLTHS